jgi:small-conductance mechanosensitive channel
MGGRPDRSRPNPNRFFPGGRAAAPGTVASALNVKNHLAGALAALALVMAVILAFGVGPLAAQPVHDAGIMSKPPLLQSLEAAVEAERADAKVLGAESEGLKHLKKNLGSEISAYKIAQNTYHSLLLLPQAPLADIKQAAAANNQTQAAIGNRLKDLRQKIKEIDAAIVTTDQKIEVYRQQTDALKAMPTAQDQTLEMLKALRLLIQLLTDKQKDLKASREIVGELITAFEAAEKACADLTVRMAQMISAQSRQQLFERQGVGFGPEGRQKIQAELVRLGNSIASPATSDYWKAVAQGLQAMGVLPVLAFWGVLGAILMLFNRLKKVGGRREQDPGMDQTPWRRLAFQMINRSLRLGGAWVVVAGFAKIQPPSSVWLWTSTAADILAVFLLTNWFLVFIKYGIFAGQRLLDAGQGRRLRRLVVAIRILALVYLPLDRFFGGAGMLLSLVRLALEATLAVWCMTFFKRRRQAHGQAASKPFDQAASWLCHLIAFAGLLMELAGYGFLARYWYFSWARCLAASLWGAVIFMMLREWQTQIRKPGLAGGGTVAPGRWLTVQGCWLVFWAALILTQIQAWATGPQLWKDVLNLIHAPMAIGNISISLSGIGFALMVVIITYAASKLWHQLLNTKLLAGSGLETGFQNSLVTISRYLLWVVGAMMALNVLGVSSTSMAVVFGALSVGLGFGLQNIFNNFISGIILLFERPIQVGDTVEINGIWAVVKKINVRSTLVQTYDNASLIIPNSEFISNQVVNWSHKDQRLRRAVTVGVAYGADVEQVRQVLLAIAASNPLVLAEPRPQVLFEDFGDSALIFKLRFWTQLESLPRTDTDVRFEINRRFKAMGIEIPFPQRDVHLRSVAAGPAEVAPGQASGGSVKREKGNDHETAEKRRPC